MHDDNEIRLIPGQPRGVNTGKLYRPGQEPPIKPYESPLDIKRAKYQEPINNRPGPLKKALMKFRRR